MKFSRFRSVLPALVALLFFSACDSNNSSDETDDIVITDISLGSGTEVFESTTIIVSYVGKLVDGTVFDSSERRGENLAFTPAGGNVVEGLLQGVIGMKVGGVRRIEIPSHLGFGQNGFCFNASDCPVPSNADIVFEITVVDVLDYVLIETIEAGSGDEVADGDRIRIQYAVALQNGSIIDSSVDDSFLEFTVGSPFLIDGLHEGVIGMKVGGSRLLTIPPALAYGEFGDTSGAVPPYAILLFRIDLLSKQPSG